MIKVKIIAALSTFLLVATFLLAHLTGTVHANSFLPRKPNINCAPCSSIGEWDGNQHGAKTTMIVDNPGLGSEDRYSKYILVSDPGQSDSVYVGIDNGGYCTQNNIEYFYSITNSSGVQIYSNCYPVNKGDINNYVTVGVSFYASHGGGTFVWIDGTVTGDDPCNPCAIPTGSSGERWNAISLNIWVQKLSWTGHLVWGGDWYLNKYFDGTNWDYQHRNFDSLYAGKPPQMYWHIVPASGNDGGDLYSCVYSSGTTCTFGGLHSHPKITFRSSIT